MSRFPLSRAGALAFGLALITASPGPAVATTDDDATVARVEDYLNALTTMRADFLQVADDGSVSQGVLYLSRPGRLRLEYAPPMEVLMVADGAMLTFVDRALGQISQIALSETPAGLLVGKDIRFDGEVTVNEVTREAAVVRVTVSRTRRPGEGSLTLVFTEAPFDLRQWIVVDSQGLATRITLFNAQKGLALDPALFVSPAPEASTSEGR